MATFTGNPGQDDNFQGGVDPDLFRFNVADLTGADILVGAGNFDTLELLSSGTVVAASLAGVSGIEAITYAAAGNNVTINDSFMTANPGVLVVNGSAGNDTFDASSVTIASGGITVTAGTGTDTFRGGAGADTFKFAGRTTGDTVVGGSGASVDTLEFTTASIGLTTSDQDLLSGLERIVFSGGTNSVSLKDALVGSANGQTLVVLGGAGNDTIYGANVTTAGNKLDITAGAGNDTLDGGAGNDTFRFVVGELTNADAVKGRGGVDTLVLSGTGTLSTATLVDASLVMRVSQIEAITLAAAGITLNLDNAFVTANPGTLTINGFAGNDVVDASGVTVTAGGLTIIADSGTDVLRGGLGTDTFRFNARTTGDTVAGGGGTNLDTLEFTAAVAMLGSDFAGITAIERVVFAGGVGLNNSANFTDALVGSALNTTLFVVGGAGNDTLYGGNVTTAGNKLDFTSGTGNDTLNGGSGNDIFRFVVGDLTGADTVVGKGGVDTLVLTGAGSVSGMLGGVSQVEAIAFGNGGITVVLDNAFVGLNPNTLTITGSSGNDTLDASAVTVAAGGLNVTAGAGTDTFRGGFGTDTFSFDARTTGDTVDGGGGASLDTLQFTVAVALLTADLSGLSGIERIVFANGAGTSSSVNLTDALAASATGGLRLISGAGNDTFYGGSVVNPANTLDFTAGSGNDTLTGGSGSDTFRISVADLTSADALKGQGGVSDTLNFSTAGTISTAALANVAGMERIVLAAGTNTFTLTNAIVDTAAGHYLNVLGSSGNDTVDGSATTLLTSRLDISAGGGNDTLKGGAAVDKFRFATAELTGADTVDGGTSANKDQLIFSNAGTVAAAAFAGVTHIEQVLLAAAGNNVTLSDALVASADTMTLEVGGGAGNDTVNGSAVLAGHKLDLTAGAGSDSLTGGAGDDTFRFYATEIGSTDTVVGGGGFDTLFFTTGSATIGAAALAGVSGIEAITFNLSAVNLTVNDAFAVNNAAQLVINGAGGNDIVDASSVTNAARSILAYANYGTDVFRGGAGNDTFVLVSKPTGDTFAGNGGTDTIQFTAAITSVAADWSGVSGIEQITLFDGGTNSLALTNAMVGSALGTLLTVTGGSGNDTVNASTVTTAGNRVVLIGGSGGDALTGGAGNDTIDGGSGSNTLAGGNGFDLFRFLVRDHVADSVTDFSSADDTLQFDFSLFDANGPSFNTRTIATSTATDITGADLLIYTGDVLNTAADVQAYLAAAGGSVNEGLFIAGTNSGGQTVLFHAVDASATTSTDVDLVATLGTLTSATALQLGDFAFI